MRQEEFDELRSKADGLTKLLEELVKQVEAQSASSRGADQLNEASPPGPDQSLEANPRGSDQSAEAKAEPSLPEAPSLTEADRIAQPQTTLYAYGSFYLLHSEFTTSKRVTGAFLLLVLITFELTMAYAILDVSFVRMMFACAEDGFSEFPGHRERLVRIRV